MNREIKFRGYWEDGIGVDEEWVYGFLYIDSDDGDYYIQDLMNLSESAAIEPKTIGQYTGLKDKNGKEIYEGDVVVAWSAGYRAVGEVKQRIDGLWIMYPAYQKGKLWGLCPNPKGETSVEIIGNIHENPELLGGTQ